MKRIALALLLGSVCYSSLLLATPAKPTTASEQTTIEQITQLAEKGDPASQFLLGERYFKGQGFLKTPK